MVEEVLAEADSGSQTGMWVQIVILLSLAIVQPTVSHCGSAIIAAFSVAWRCDATDPGSLCLVACRVQRLP